MQKIGFIGCGKMASAIIKGILNSNFIEPENVIASKFSSNNLEEKSKELGIKIILDNKFVAQTSNIIFLATEPSEIKSVLKELSNLINKDHLIISIAAGISTTSIESVLKPDVRVIRAMPNTPLLIGEGMTGICAGKNTTNTDLEYVKKLFSSIGQTAIIEESNFDILTAISGSGPAFFYKIINDIARSGEKLGLDYEKALQLAIQTAIGASKMAQNSTLKMEELIENVATKGGCTRVGIDKMNELNTSEMFFEVIKETSQKAKSLGK